MASDNCLVLRGIPGVSCSPAEADNLAQKVHIAGIKLGSPAQVRQSLFAIPRLVVDVADTTQYRAGFFLLVVAQVDIGQDAQLCNTLVQQAATHVDVTQFNMSARVLRFQAYHLVQDGDGVVYLAVAAVVTYQVGILLQCAIDAALASRNLCQCGIYFVLMGCRAFHLAQGSLHLILPPGSSIGFGQQHGDFHFWSLVFFALFAGARSPCTGIESCA